MATKHKYNSTATRWTYGCEFELDDWPRRDGLPDGMQIDHDWSMVNSNGVAVDGPGELYHLGGEILARPSDTPDGVANQMATIINRWPQTTVNHRTGIHVHIRVPGLRDDLVRLKRLQKNIHAWMWRLLPIVDPFEPVTFKAYPLEHEWVAANRYYARQNKGQRFLMPKARIEDQMKATSTQQFFEAEALHKPTGRVHWTTVPRACVNLRQLLQTDTVEFRHFYGTMNPLAVEAAIRWCKAFLEEALSGTVDPGPFVEWTTEVVGEQRCVGAWPKFIPYVHWLEEGYRLTSRHYHPKDIVRKNIADWLAKKRPVSLPGERP